MARSTQTGVTVETIPWGTTLSTEAKQAWHKLLACIPTTAFCYPEWIEAARTAGVVHPQQVVIFHRGDRPVGLLVLQKRTPWTATVLDHLAYEDPLLLMDPAAQDEALPVMLTWLLRESGLGLIRLGRYGDQQQLDALQHAAENAGGIVYRRPVMGGVSMAVPASWDGYLATLSPKRRSAIRYAESVFHREYPNGELRIYTDGDSCAAAVEAMVRLSCLRWRDDEGSYFERPANRAFYREAIRWAADRGFASMHSLYVDGQEIAVASALHVPGQQKAYYHLVGRDPHALPKRHSPGTVVMCQVIRWAIDRGATLLSLGQHMCSYKAAMGGEEYPQWEIFLARSPLERTVLARLDPAVQIIRQLPEKLLQRITQR